MVTADSASYDGPSLLTSLSAHTEAFSSVNLVDASLNFTFANISGFDILLVFGYLQFAGPANTSVEIAQFIDNGGYLLSLFLSLPLLLHGYLRKG